MSLGRARAFKFGLVEGSWFSGPRCAVIGKYALKSTFTGTDRLSMAVQPDFIHFLASVKEQNRREPGKYRSALFEGDRLFNASLLSSAAALCDEVKIIIIETSAEEKTARHIRRKDTQTITFQKSKATKVQRIKEQFPNHVIVANETPHDLLAAVDFLIAEVLNETTQSRKG